MIVLLVVLLLIFGVGGYLDEGPDGWPRSARGGVSLVLLILLVLVLTGHLGHLR